MRTHLMADMILSIASYHKYSELWTTRKGEISGFESTAEAKISLTASIERLDMEFCLRVVKSN